MFSPQPATEFVKFLLLKILYFRFCFPSVGQQFFISFAFVSTDSIDNLGGDEFDEDGGVGGAPKVAEGGPVSFSGPKEAEGGPTSGPTEADEGPTSGPTHVEGGPNFGPKEAEEGSNSGPEKTEIGNGSSFRYFWSSPNSTVLIKFVATKIVY
jgi:hypothetical protein